MRYFILLLMGMLVAGCIQPKPPALPDSKPVAASSQNSVYMRALQDMNTLVSVYYPPDQQDIHYYVKPITDATNISAHTGDIPLDIADMVRAAFGDIHNKISVLEHYTVADLAQLQVQKEQGQAITGGDRPLANFVVAGTISMYDRGLESTSRSPRVMGSFGGGRGSVDASASMKDSSGKDRIGVILRVSYPSGKSLPGRFGAEMELWYAKDGIDIGFSIAGIGFGYATEGVAIQGRHQALKLICDLSVVQIVGRTLGLPYWRVPLNRGEFQKIYDEDAGVIRGWNEEYSIKLHAAATGAPLPDASWKPLIASMQAACIANGENEVVVNNVPDDPRFQAALDRLAQKYGVRERNDRRYAAFPSFEMFKALEQNRLLDVYQAELAWGQLAQFSSGKAAPAPVRPAKVSGQPAPKQSRPAPKNGGNGTNYDQALEGLL